VQQKSTGVSNYRYTAIVRHSLRNGFNGFLRALLGDHAWLPPSSADRSAHLAPASERQDHATSPSAATSFVRAKKRLTLPRPSHPVPNVRDDREPPLWRDGIDRLYSCFYLRVKRTQNCVIRRRRRDNLTRRAASVWRGPRKSRNGATTPAQSGMPHLLLCDSGHSIAAWDLLPLGVQAGDLVSMAARFGREFR
jgi:hypothetical protein